MKKLFTNYNFEFDKNEIRLLITFCKQTLKQTENDNRFFSETKAFNSILNKLNSNEDTIKLTKDERTRLVLQLKNNIDYIDKKIKKSWFFKKWLYKSLYNQYEDLIENHFKD
jgi:hypothetical protein